MRQDRQTRFDFGELSPTLHGRDDIEQFRYGTYAMDGFIPTRHGTAMSRPGLEFIGSLGTVGVVSQPRLAAITLSNDVSLILAFSDEPFGAGPVVHVFLNGAEVAPSSPVVHPYAGAQLQDLRFVQFGATLLVTHPSHQPQLYTVTAISPSVTIAAETLNFDVKPYTGIEPLLVEPCFIGDATHPAKEWQFYVSCLMRTPGGVVYETAAVKVTRSVLFFGQPGPHNNNIRDFAQTSVLRSIEASAGAPAGAPNGYILAIYPDQPAEIDFARDVITTGAYGARTDQDTIVGTIVYRGRGDIIGRVGRVLGDQLASADRGKRSTKATGTTQAIRGTPGRLIDYGIDPDTTHHPRSGRNPFKILDPADGVTVLRTEKPGVAAFFQERLALARTNERPNWIWFSAIDDFLNHDEFLEPTVNDPLEEQLAALGFEEVRSLVPGPGALFVFTPSGVWTVQGAGGAILSPVASRDVRQVSTAGASKLQPLQLPGGLIYERAMGGGVRDLYFSNEGGGYNSGDLSFLSQHLFDGMTLRAWGYAEVPWGTVWGARSDGKLLSLLYDRARGMVGWTPHTIADGGLAKDLVVAPEGSEHKVYVLVQRAGPPMGLPVYRLERLATRLISSPADAKCLDSFLVKTVQAGGTTGKRLTGLSHLEGRSVKLNAAGYEYGPYVVVGGNVEVNAEIPLATSCVVGLPYTPRLVQLDIAGFRDKNLLLQRALIEVEASRGMWVGADGGQMREWTQRQVSDSYDPMALYTGETLFHVESSWNPHGRLAIEQRSPFPLTIRAITREFEVSR